MLNFTERAFFKTAIFNQPVQKFLDTLLPNLIKEFCLVSAKGGTGQGFEGKLAEAISNSQDMPYHVHILNGLLPALKLLEERFVKENRLDKQDSQNIISCFIMGFTFHDINKLAKAIELKDAVEQNLITLCEKLNADAFFADWRNWIEEIKFLALGTEYRTRIYSLQKPIRYYEFFNTVLSEHCHLADAIASTDIVASVAEFYEQLCKCTLDRKKLSDIWQLSYVEVQENIFTVLSQKLLFAARSIIQERKQSILFNMRNGCVYIGEPFTITEIERIKTSFKEDLFDFLSLTQIGMPDSHSCNFEFLEMASLSREMLEEIIKVGLSGNRPKIRLLMLGNDESAEAIEIIRTLIDEYELPLKLQQRPNTQNFNIYLEKQWDELEDNQLVLLKLIGLEKIKALKSNDFPQWKGRNQQEKAEFLTGNFKYLFEGEEKQIEKIDELIANFSKPATRLTVQSIVRASEAYQENEDIAQYVETVFEDVQDVFAPLAKNANTQELDDFVVFYFRGDFEQDIQSVMELIMEIPSKKDMCLFTGRTSSQDYTSAKAFGVQARGFSNRSINTLKSDTNKVSSLFFTELSLRKKELPSGFYIKKNPKDDLSNLRQRFFFDFSKANSIIYYDFGEYFVEVMTKPLLGVLGQAFSYDCKEIQGLTLMIDDYCYDYNLYGMNFNVIGNDIKSNFDLIYQMLHLIRKTGFRIFVTSILTPYHSHKEMFVFENCMPFVKTLGWGNIRIDEIEQRLDEMKLLLSLNPKRLVSNVLNYAEDRRYLFTAFAQLDDEDKAKARENLHRYINSLNENEKEKLMSVMNNIAQIAIQMVRPKSGSASQETWIIRDALKVLKDCYKECRDKETTIEQIAGQMRKTLKNRDYVNLDMCEPFALALYDQLFAQEWEKRFPQPSRERNWIYQFAFLYNKKEDEKWKEFRRSKVREVIKKLQETQKDVTEEAVLELLFTENPQFKTYADEYREAFQEVFAETSTPSQEENSK